METSLIERTRNLINLSINYELNRAYKKHGMELWGRHEFYGVLKEEVDELWEVIKQDGPTEHLIQEALQISCVIQRYIESGDRYRGVHDLSFLEKKTCLGS